MILETVKAGLRADAETGPQNVASLAACDVLNTAHQESDQGNLASSGPSPEAMEACGKLVLDELAGASRLRWGEDAENRFSALQPSIGALSWLRAQGVDPDALALPDLPCAASIVFCDRTPLFDFGDEAAEEPMTKALIFLERNGFGEPVDLVAWAVQPRPRLASWLGSSVLGADSLDGDWRLAERQALPVWRSPLGWLRAHRDGVVIVSGAGAAVALRAAGGPFMAEDFAHAAELRRLLRPPELSILTPLSMSTKVGRVA